MSRTSMILGLVIALALWVAAAVAAQVPAVASDDLAGLTVLRAAAEGGVPSCSSVYDVQYTTDPGADGTYPSPCVDRMARVRGVVCGVADDGYFLAEAAGPWHGIYVYGIRGYTPMVGDEVEVAGSIKEYYGLTEFSFPTTTLVSSGHPLPGMTVVTAADLPYGKGSLSEPYEGVLVEVHDIQVTALDGYNIWAFTDGSGGTAKADDWFYHVAPAVGDAFTTLRGPVVYDYDEYKIMPRGAGDVATRPEVSKESPTHTETGDSTGGVEVVAIHQIQGSDFRSPYDGVRVTTAGVVLGFFEGNTPGGSQFDGFYIQDPTGDGNPATSDGILVHHGAHAVTVHVGDVVTVTGWVDEYNEYGEPGPACETQILVESAADIEWKSTAPLPSAVVLDPPGDPDAARAYFETLEGMMVTLPVTGAVVGPTSYGTIMIVPGDEGVDRVLRGSVQQGMAFGVRPEERYGGGAPSLMVGSIVTGVNGPLAYTYGNYVVVDQDGYEVEFSQPEPVPAPGWPAAAYEFTVVTLNAYDFFDTVNDPVTADAVQSVLNYEIQKSKLAHTIAQAGCPLLVALQEVENEQVLQELAAVLMAEHGCAYSTYMEEGLDERGIDVAVLAARDRVVVEGVTQYQDCTAYPTGLGQGACPEGLQRLYSRPPLVVTATVQHETLPQVTRRVVLVANHLKSKLSTEGDPESAQWRGLQAESLARLALDLASGEPEASLMVLGDLNDFEDSLPLDALYATDLLTNTWYTLAPEERYSYIYNGVSQALDHILISPDLAPLLIGVHPLRVNSDWPYLPYANDAALPARASDHDLVAATFLLGWPEIVSFDLVESEDPGAWIPVTGDLDSGYTMTLSCAVPIHLVNSSGVETSSPLPAGDYGFLLDSESVPDGFLDDWADRGVAEGSSGWYVAMGEIIHGRSPAFYLRVTDGAEGKEYRLVDGFARDFGHGADEYWWIAGNQPGGNYRFVGVIEDESGLTNTVELDLTLLAPSLSITHTVETAHTPAYPGDPVTYTVIVANRGNAGAAGVHVTDALPPGVTGTDLDWTGPVLAGGQVEFKISAALDRNPELYGQVITNAALINYLDCEMGSAVARLQVKAAGELSIVKRVQAPQDRVCAGDALTYSVIVSNEGAMTALAVVITDTLPPGVHGQDLVWQGDISAGQRVEFSVPAAVSLAPEFRGATITNTAYYRYDGVVGWDAVALTVSRGWRTYLPIILRLE